MRVYDVVIVGSGATACYAAYRLALEYPKSKCRILIVTQDANIGGRIHSLSLIGNNEQQNTLYKAELCASRFYYPVMPKIYTLAQKFALPLTQIPAANLPVVTPPADPSILANTEAQYPPNQVARNKTVTVYDAVTYSNESVTAAHELILSGGYSFLLQDATLASYYNEAGLLVGQNEYRFVQGYQGLPKALLHRARQCNKNIKFKRQTQLLSIGTVLSCDTSSSSDDCSDSTIECHDSHLVLTLRHLMRNTQYKIGARTVLYTGTLAQLDALVFVAPPPNPCECHEIHAAESVLRELHERRALAHTLLQAHAGVKIYIHVQDPWWPANAKTKFFGFPLLTQMIYYTSNTLLFYVLGDEAPKLRSMFEQDFSTLLTREEKTMLYEEHWIDTILVPKFMTFLQVQIPRIIATAIIGPQPVPSEAQLRSMDRIVFHYAHQTTTTPRALTGHCDLKQEFKLVWRGCPRRTHHPRFYYLGGDLEMTGGGWVERCFDNVDRQWKSITHRLRD